MKVRIGRFNRLYSGAPSIEESIVGSLGYSRNVSSSAVSFASMLAEKRASELLDRLVESIELLGSEHDEFDGSLDLVVGNWFSSVLRGFDESHDSDASAARSVIMGRLSGNWEGVVIFEQEEGDGFDGGLYARYPLSLLLECAIAADGYVLERERKREEARREERAREDAEFKAVYGGFENPKSGKELQARVVGNLLSKAGIESRHYSDIFRPAVEGVRSMSVIRVDIERYEYRDGNWVERSEDEIADIVASAVEVLEVAGLKVVYQPSSLSLMVRSA